MRFRMRIAAAMLGAALFTLAAPIAATAQPDQAGGAAGVVAAVVQVQDVLNELQVLSGNGNVEIVTVKDSLNNVLQNARFLNNIQILQDFLNGQCQVASCIEITDVLNNNDVAISDVIAIDVLSGGDIVVFAR